MLGKKPISLYWQYIGGVRRFRMLKSMAYVPNFNEPQSRLQQISLKDIKNWVRQTNSVFLILLKEV